MFFHKHPYLPFIPQQSKKLIVGTLPPPRFSTGQLLFKDVDFSYGSYFNSLWLFLDTIYDLNLTYNQTKEAIHERKSFLIQHQIGICDVVESCWRKKWDASDLGMERVKLRPVLYFLDQYTSINTLLFIGGNCKNGPLYFFKSLLKEVGVYLGKTSKTHPKTYSFTYNQRKYTAVALISSSGSANRAIGSIEAYKKAKNVNPNYNTFDFRIDQYKNYF